MHMYVNADVCSVADKVRKIVAGYNISLTLRCDINHYLLD